MDTNFRKPKTISGMPFDIAKSAIQKYIRRGHSENAMKIGIQLDAFRTVQAGKMFWTNYRNRLRITFLEDIGLAYPEFLISMDTLLDVWEFDESQIGKSSMLALIRNLAESKHSRYFSHVKHYCLGLKNINVPDPEFVYDEIKDPDLQKDVNGLIWCIENHDKRAWYFGNRILSIEKLDFKVDGGSRSGLLIFDILLKMDSRYYSRHYSRYINICKKWYKLMKMKEQFLCCMFPVYLMTFAMKLSEKTIIIFGEEDIYSNQNYDVDLDDFVFDMHTSIGRLAGRTSTEFGVDGSIVCRDIQLDQKLHNAYTLSKIGTILKESEAFHFKARCQLICSNVRPDSYFAKTRAGTNVVVKGPYSSYDEVFEMVMMQSFMNRYEGVNTIGTSILYLYPDMFRNGYNRTCLGSRGTFQVDKAAYFIVMKDLFGLEEYPTHEKSSVKWDVTPVADYERIFKDGKYGFGFAETMSKEAAFSFALQITFRYIYKMGDFAARNFLRVGNKVWNLDVNSTNIGDTIRLSKNNASAIVKSIYDNESKFCEIIGKWVNVDPSIAERVRKILENPNSVFLQ